MTELKCRSIRIEFLSDQNLRTETHKTVFEKDYYLKPMKTVLARHCSIPLNRKWVMEACFYGGKKFVFVNNVT